MFLQEINERVFPEVYKDENLHALLFCLMAAGENGMHVRELVSLFAWDNRAARKEVERLRRAGVVVCADDERGYFLPAEKNELFRWLRKENRRSASISHMLRPAMLLFDEGLREDLVKAGLVETSA